MINSILNNKNQQKITTCIYIYAFGKYVKIWKNNYLTINKEMEIDLRDYFACQVISELLKAETDNFTMLHGKTDENILFINSSKLAYKVADAMIYVRELNSDKNANK